MTGNYSAMSKLDLAKECGRLAELLAQAEAKPVAAAPATPDRVPEADALAGCARALDALPKTSETLSGYSASRLQPDQATIRRVLRALADKYGIPLVESITEVRDCNRAHLDQIDPGTFLAALGNSVVPR